MNCVRLTVKNLTRLCFHYSTVMFFGNNQLILFTKNISNLKRYLNSDYKCYAHLIYLYKMIRYIFII